MKRTFSARLTDEIETTEYVLFPADILRNIAGAGAGGGSNMNTSTSFVVQLSGVCRAWYSCMHPLIEMRRARAYKIFRNIMLAPKPSWFTGPEMCRFVSDDEYHDEIDYLTTRLARPGTISIGYWSNITWPYTNGVFSLHDHHPSMLTLPDGRVSDRMLSSCYAYNQMFYCAGVWQNDPDSFRVFLYMNGLFPLPAVQTLQGWSCNQARGTSAPRLGRQMVNTQNNRAKINVFASSANAVASKAMRMRHAMATLSRTQMENATLRVFDELFRKDGSENVGTQSMPAQFKHLAGDVLQFFEKTENPFELPEVKEWCGYHFFIDESERCRPDVQDESDDEETMHAPEMHPVTDMHISSISQHVLGRILRNAINRPLPD